MLGLNLDTKNLCEVWCCNTWFINEAVLEVFVVWETSEKKNKQVTETSAIIANK